MCQITKDQMINYVYKKAKIWKSLQSLIKVSFQDGVCKGRKSDKSEKNWYDIFKNSFRLYFS